MTEEMYSVEQVAEQLGLHVRTVRGYIRSGRLKAVRIGKQYRIARSDLAELTGRTRPATAGPGGSAEVSSIVQVDGVDRAAADRLGTLVLAGANTSRGSAHPLRIQTVHDEERNRMKIVVLGSPGDTAEVLQLLEAVLDGDNGLFSREAGDA
ncbi:helix-turn-helix domain-containing protein [Saccharopolyspora erythraea]|uniref:Excisionase/Xis, DNA-binding n=2 Tax=Saccharopolyspora erythraea TaxID=1836 RepID=A4FLA6_SACEN|nr:helix-turn-helix domain-containing protein [Saccharopolyspora erythraea]EQD85230.1 MerR family transcriptional regulator [Saccharopolyspora erythraea D]CAM04831.1 excisionase/Xis, DNA-binding [Saccharopolyspora erythraea NRRL 2338]